MKLHELKPAPGSRKPRTRVGRGIAAGKGKTAGRGTKGQKSRAGSGIPAWFEGGQTPIHIRVPKLRGFKRRFKIQYQVVNVGRISDYASAGRFGVDLEAGGEKRSRAKGADPVTVNAEVLASAGLVGSDRRPIKILGEGDVGLKLFVLADAFTASARRKIEEAGGFVQLMNPPAEPALAEEPAVADEPTSADAAPTAMAPEPEPAAAEAAPTAEEAPPAVGSAPTAGSATTAEEAPAPEESEPPARPARAAKSTRAAKPARAADEADLEPEPDEKPRRRPARSKPDAED